MIEIPEAIILAKEINQTLKNKEVKDCFANSSPHKFAWYHNDPQNYKSLLIGKRIKNANSYGGFIEIDLDGVYLLFSEGLKLTYHQKQEKRPSKHQLLIEFTDDTALSASIQMYGGLWCYEEGTLTNKYFTLAKSKPSPLSSNFTKDYFASIINSLECENLSIKALLATEQRIPGLGNGVLHDILLNAKVHPKRKVKTLTDVEKVNIYDSIINTLNEMVLQGGRDTEYNLYGQKGNYKTRLSKLTVDKPCSVCGELIKKEAYLGGSIYYCPHCQK